MSFARVYPLYIEKAENKLRSKTEVDEIIRWQTGYNQKQLEAQLKKQTDLETFFAEAPQQNPARALITGVICGVRVEDIQEPTLQEIRYLDKLIDELAKGKTMEKILRKKCTQRGRHHRTRHNLGLAEPEHATRADCGQYISSTLAQKEKIWQIAFKRI